MKNWFEFAVNAFWLTLGLAFVSIPSGIAAIACYTVAGFLATSPLAVACLAGVGGVIFAQLFFSVILPIFGLPRLGFRKMLGWYVAFGVGYTACCPAGMWVHRFVSIPWYVPAALLSAGVPFLIAKILTPLGIVGFPNRKFDK